MTSRDEAVKVGADAMHKIIPDGAASENAAKAFDAAYAAGLIVWADELRAVHMWTDQDGAPLPKDALTGDVVKAALLYRKRETS